ncbi:MAG: hypothetical protein AB7O24_24550 [Kofleriaceae bacterium]
MWCARTAGTAGLVIILALAACSKSAPARKLDLELIKVPGAANLRTDTIGDGTFTDVSTFVLVDAQNTATEGAYVTLGGQLTDGSSTVLGELKSQSLWIPAGEIRTFALVDAERVPRPKASAARIVVHGALVPESPPRVRVSDFRTFAEPNRTIVEGKLVNDADRLGQALVIAAFYDSHGQLMTRPFQNIVVDPQGRMQAVDAKTPTDVVRFVGPPGSVRGTMFVGDIVY